MGLPVDVKWLNLIFENKKVIANALAEACNQHYGTRFYARNSVNNTYSFRHTGLEAYLDNLPFPIEWDYTDSGAARWIYPARVLAVLHGHWAQSTAARERLPSESAALDAFRVITHGVS